MGIVNSVTAAGASGKVVLCDGSVRLFNEPLTAAELMLEHPRQVVVEIHSAVASRRPTPLPADEKLDFRKVYLMVPMRGGKTASLSSEEIRRVILCASSGLRSRGSLKLLPCFAKIWPAVNGGGGGSFPVRFMEEKRETEMLPESLEVRPEYLSRQLSGKGWKPGLETIKEKKIEKKLSHWLFNFK